MMERGFEFTPLMDFYSPEVQSFYHKGLGYEVNPGNELLAGLVREWLHKGKVAERVPGARINGEM